MIVRQLAVKCNHKKEETMKTKVMLMGMLASFFLSLTIVGCKAKKEVEIDQSYESETSIDEQGDDALQDDAVMDDTVQDDETSTDTGTEE